VQTAAVCVALATVPAGLQLNERHAAGEEVKRLHTQLLATQNERVTVQTEIERLRAISGRLERSVTPANEAAARAAASAQAFEVWKKRTRGLLTAADYRWPDDSPFVRIPKSALPELSRVSVSQAEPFLPPGVVEPYARELMGLTASERQSLEEALHRHFANVEERLAAGIYETNKPPGNGFTGAAVATAVFVLPGLGEEATQLTDHMLAEVHGILGEERWPLVQARFQKPRSRYGLDLGNILNLGPNDLTQELIVWVTIDDKGTPTMAANWSGAVAGEQSGTLSRFLPESDPNRTDGADRFGGAPWSQALRQRGLAWLQEQAIARLGKGARP